MDDDLMELSGDHWTDRAAVTIYKYVWPNEIADHEKRGWKIVGTEGNMTRMSISSEEYVE